MKFKGLITKELNPYITLLVLIVIGIIIYPVFFIWGQRHVERGPTWCITNLQQLGMALEMYQDDWGDTVLVCSSKSVWGHGSKRGWTEKLRTGGYVIRNIFCCSDRNINFAYAMNRRIVGTKPRQPGRCVAIYECPGSGDSKKYPVRLGKDNWYDSRGKPISWATGDANQTGEGIIRLIGKSRCADYSWMPSPSVKNSTADISYSQLVLPGVHRSIAFVLFCDGHVQNINLDNAASECLFDPNDIKAE